MVGLNKMKYDKDKTKVIKEYLSGKKCERCGSDYELTLDHIIPVDFLIHSLGLTVDETYDYENFQPLCRRCNTLKSGRFDLSDERTKILAIKYINKYCK
jgi:5-methylcytosine-specific restriction endonuclease McrA